MPINDPVLKRLAIDTLSKALVQDTSAKVRAEAAIALGKMKDDRAIQALCLAQAEELDPVVRQQITAAIGDIGEVLMTGDRIINTSGGDYLESGDKVKGAQIKVNLSQDLAQSAAQIQDLLTQLQNAGITVDEAQENVAEDIAKQAAADPTVKAKLLKWGQSLGDATVTDVVKGVVKLALRSAGLPLP
jgi:HEAT repeats